MDKNLIEQIRKDMEAKSTEELQKILSDNDRERYYDETFEAVKQLLLEREETISSKGEEIILLSEQAQEKSAWGIGSKICLIYVVLFVIFKVVGPKSAYDLDFTSPSMFGIIFVVCVIVVLVAVVKSGNSKSNGEEKKEQDG